MEKIILASVLKPVNDTRVYEKFGRSIAKLSNVEVVIFGSQSNLKSNDILESNIRFKPYKKESTRLNVSRLFYHLLLVEKPDKIIIHTIELLPIILLYKWKNRSVKLYYDILENYPLNFIAQYYYSPYKKYLLSIVAKMIENLSYPFLNHIFLAEKTYLNEKRLPKYKSTVLENKYAPLLKQTSRKTDQEIIITFCGTLTKSFGVINFINFISDLNSCKNKLNIKFLIIGKAYEDDVLQKLNVISDSSNVELIGINEFVPHLEIIKAMQNSTCIALPYPLNDSTKNCIPTKMYECLAMGIPMLIQHNSKWENFLQSYSNNMFIDFNNFSVPKLYDYLEKIEKSKRNIVPSAFWSTEEEKLLNILSRKD